MRKNEQALCEAVIRRFEKHEHAVRTDVTHPEKDGSGPPVEVRFRLGSVRYAIEHTLVEPFEKSIEWGAEFEAFAREIVDTLDGSMPSPGIYDLVFPIHPTRGQHRRRHPALRAAIIEWVRAMAFEMFEECPTRPDRERRPHGYEGVRETNIGGIDLLLKRRAHWAQSGTRHDGILFVSRLVEGNIEPLRRDRIEIALNSKFRKLQHCRDDGDTTICILEFGDIALTSHVSIAEALEPLLEGRVDVPDHMFIADTTDDELWYLFHVLNEDVFSIGADWIDIGPGPLSAQVAAESASEPGET